MMCKASVSPLRETKTQKVKRTNSVDQVQSQHGRWGERESTHFMLSSLGSEAAVGHQALLLLLLLLRWLGFNSQYNQQNTTTPKDQIKTKTKQNK